jgi:polar amino acid transport system substrate-binding protein
MIQQKNHLKFLVLFSLLLSGSTLYSQESLRIKSDYRPPFTNMEGQHSIALELVREGLQRSGYQVKFDVGVIEDYQQALTDYDGLAAEWENEELAETHLLSIPYIRNQLILISRKGEKVDYKSIEELENTSLGIVKGLHYEINEQLHPSVELKESMDNQTNLQLLLQGEIDHMLVDALLMQYLMDHQATKVDELLAVGEHTLLNKSLHLALRKDLKGSTELISRFNDAIIAMVEDGTYNQILRLNHIVTDLNEDGRAEMILSDRNIGTTQPYKPYTLHGVSHEPETFHVGDEVYTHWEQVPEIHKSPNMDHEIEGFTFLRFNF